MTGLIEIILFIPLAVMVGYICFFSFAAVIIGKNKAKITIEDGIGYQTIAILVPAYKEDNVILSTTKHLLNLKYPPKYFKVYVIADSLQNKTIHALKELPVQVIEVKFDKSTKSLALNAALEKIQNPYDIALICDADNILHSNFLLYINSAFNRGHTAIQGQRIAKNMDTNFSILDSASEIINNHIFRKGHNAIGLSSSVIGSGMCFSFDLFKTIMKNIDAVGGFDKVLQLELVKRNIHITYLEPAIIFDEKITHSQAFGVQRKRWLSSQFIYLKKYSIQGIKMLFKGKINYFNLSVMHNILLPRVILIGLLPILLISSILLNRYSRVPPTAWGILCLSYYGALLVALPKLFFRRQLLSSLSSLPGAFLIMTRGL
ncbi:MAG TPA: glycosyltransferase family 2 protein, partial [Candidatus Babeliaceae bacterium]|nr:glycosyltransferase family 2 protein [Candidatus Babeliaceae bacterium]